MNKNNPSRDPYQHKPEGLINVVFDLQEDEKLSDFLPPTPSLVIGIPSVLFVAWLSIWMGAILMGGCVKPYDFPDYSSTQAMHAEHAPDLDAVLERAITTGQKL